MLILGIDPGYAIVGYGVIEYSGNRFRYIEHGAITTEAGVDFSQRLQHIANELYALIDRYDFDSVAIEKLYFHSNQKTAIQVAEARGVILLVCADKGLDIFEYTPLQVKTAVTGYGRAKKPQVMEMTRRILKLAEVPRPDDAADALAIAICHGHLAGTELRRRLIGGGRVTK